jgi:hypothetical protein
MVVEQLGEGQPVAGLGAIDKTILAAGPGRLQREVGRWRRQNQRVIHPGSP